MSDTDREYTIPELDSAVEAQTITVQQKEQILQNQQRKVIQRTIAEAVPAALAEVQVTTAVHGDLGEYQSLVPDLMRDGTQTRERVRREYEYLVQRGAPANHSTELAAARAALGPIERIRDRRRAAPEPWADGGARGAPSYDSDPRDPNSPPPGLRPEEHKHYSRLIDRGVYAGWEAVKAERSWSRGANNTPSRRNPQGRFTRTDGRA